MKLQLLALAALSATVMAVPYTPAGYGGNGGSGSGSGSGGNTETSAPYVPCSGLEATPQCCAVNVLGVADLDCKSRK